MHPSMAMENHVTPGINSLLDLVEEPHKGFLPTGFVAHVEEDWLLAQDLTANLIDPGDKLVLACHDQRRHMERLEQFLSNIILPAAPKVRSPNMDTRRWLTVAGHGFSPQSFIIGIGPTTAITVSSPAFATISTPPPPSVATRVVVIPTSKATFILPRVSPASRIDIAAKSETILVRP